ncbi:hypothetical protein PFISCL1PPCAC_6151, partial [Pristionchus fissidentatus]
GSAPRSLHTPLPSLYHSATVFCFCLTPLSTSTSIMAKTKTIHKEKRNERERNRVHQVNIGFDRLRTTVQRISANKKMSKADTLREATRYIAQLKEILEKSGPIAVNYAHFIPHPTVLQQLHYSMTSPWTSPYSLARIRANLNLRQITRWNIHNIIKYSTTSPMAVDNPTSLSSSWLQ